MGIKAADLLVGKNGSAHIPWCEETAPGKFSPSGLGNIVMYITWPQADPGGGGEMAQRITEVGMDNYFGHPRRAGRKKKEEGVVRPGISSFCNIRFFINFFQGYPTFPHTPDNYL